ncbi:MAG: hypothetical protein LUB61_04565 [Eggerthellaceae bacterium]|nr:hypothetical protein [Eggerthellaceae bacterium]
MSTVDNIRSHISILRLIPKYSVNNRSYMLMIFYMGPLEADPTKDVKDSYFLARLILQKASGDPFGSTRDPRYRVAMKTGRFRKLNPPTQAHCKTAEERKAMRAEVSGNVLRALAETYVSFR